MDELDFSAFATLFAEAFQKCFGLAFANPMTETEAKLFCNKVLDQTGLSIGWKSVKNYSIFIADSSARRQENPSAATLDTLARYVLGAPYTTEIRRKDDESHNPYWFLYRERFVSNAWKGKSKPAKPVKLIFFTILILFAGAIISLLLFRGKPSGDFTDDFHRLDEGTLSKNGWFVKSTDASYWERRDETAGRLTLFTLKGDNWPDPSAQPEMKNLLLHEVKSDCFTTEVHLDDFVPAQEWQQAGLLLLEDTVLTGKSIRLSLAFNDNFGGNKMPSEIYVQVITALGNGFGKPEELAHKQLFYLDSIKNNPAIMKNLENSALRIEKHGNLFRFLYSGGAAENGAFREIASQEFAIKPKYIGIFAIKGFTNSAIVPVHFKLFKLSSEACN
ncbi:MAG TPA: hypothetical protein VFE53_07540 [Mucilaginibacter sp.]|jgi:hypothetical protein|nr:hypothetical protein [Mucilaginibacter sp.]